MKEILSNRVGEINYNNFGTKMEIIKYINSKNVIIEFENGYTTTTEYKCFKNGTLRSLYDKNIYGVGYFGEGKYKRTKENEKTLKQYDVWHLMLRRCYDEKYIKKHTTYKNCTVCDEWLCFQNFANWYDESYYTVGDEEMNLDKDILHKGNKIYCPNNCIFMPERINILFIKNDINRGNLPIGVSYYKLKNNYVSYIRKGKRIKENIGYFNTPIEAFNKYKKEKEKYIKEVADEYKDKIPDNLYRAMIDYKVEITD